MKIIFASEIFPPDIGGPATYVEKVAAKMVSGGHQVTVLTYSNKDIEENDKNYNFRIFRVKRRNNILLRYFSYFKNLYRLSKDTDLIYAQGPVPSGLPAVLVKVFTGKKVVIKVVGDFSWERSRNVYGSTKTIDEFQKIKHPIKIKFLRWLQKTVLNKAGVVITPSNYLKKIIHGWGIRDNKIQVIYNAVEQLNCSLSKDQAKEKIGYDGDIILSIGRLASWKGFEMLIKTFPKLLEVNDKFILLIVGSGPDKDKLQKLIKDSNLTDKIVLTGQIDHQEIPVYMKAADLFVLNTGYEGLPHLVVEALVMGLPIITTNIGGNPEVIENNFNGLLVEYDNEEQLLTAVRKLWPDKELQNMFRENSKKSFEKFHFEKMYQDTLLLLEQQ